MGAKKAVVRVKELMVRDVVTVRPEDALSEAVSLMFENRITAMPVTDQRRRCKGVLSTTDLVALSYRQAAESAEPEELDRFFAELADAERNGSRLGQRQVADVMSTDPVTVTHEDTILVAAREMLRNRVHRLVVVDGQQRVIGILSTMDLLEAFAAQSEAAD